MKVEFRISQSCQSLCQTSSLSPLCFQLIVDAASPFLDGDDEQIVEEEEVDWGELCPHVEERSSFRHFLQLSLLLQVSCLGDDRDGLQRTETVICFSK